MAEAIAMKTCRTIMRENPKWALGNLLGAAVLGLCAAVLLNWWLVYTTPQEPELLTLPNGKPYLVEPRSVGGAWLFMHFKSDPAASCIRQTVHLLYRDVPGKPRDFYPLASGLSGGNMAGSVPEATTRFLLPVGFPPGRWQYVQRAHYACPPMELVPHVTNIGPIDVDIPPLVEKDFSQ